jgi:hypothetical protein
VIHPEMRRRYRLAYVEWVTHPELAEACRVLGMSELEWAKRYVEQMGPIVFTTNSSAPTYLFDPEQAWYDAHRPVAAESA